jgi:hypothetical protein
MTFEAERFTIRHGGRVIEKGHVEGLAPRRHPKPYEYAPTEVNRRPQGLKYPGIYLLEGDLLIACIGYRGGARRCCPQRPAARPSWSFTRGWNQASDEPGVGCSPAIPDDIRMPSTCPLGLAQDRPARGGRSRGERRGGRGQGCFHWGGPKRTGAGRSQFGGLLPPFPTCLSLRELAGRRRPPGGVSGPAPRS